MKLKNILLVAIVFFFAMSVESFAQRQANGRGCNLPDLTPEQQSQIEELRTTQLAASTTHRARMDELRAKKRTLSIAPDADLDEINRVIDQMESVRSEHFKANEAHKQAVRNILTDEQRAVFDARTANRGQGQKMNRRGNRQDNFRGQCMPRRGRN